MRNRSFNALGKQNTHPIATRHPSLLQHMCKLVRIGF